VELTSTLFTLHRGGYKGRWGDIRPPLTDSGRSVAPPEISRQNMFPI